MSTDVNAPVILADNDAERATLGALMIDGQAIHEVADQLRPADFYWREHQCIYAAMLNLHAGDHQLDYITITDAVRRIPDAPELGTYIVGLVQEVPSAFNVQAYVLTVRELAERRRIVDLCSDLVRDAHKRDLPIGEVRERLLGGVFAATRGDPEDRLRKLNVVLGEIWDGFAATGDTDRPLFPTGYRGLDSMLGGLRKGALLIFAARTGDGKTALSSNVAVRAARAGRSVLIFSLEMTAKSLAERFLTAESNVSLVRLSGGDLRDGEYPALSDATGDLADLPIWVDDTPMISMPVLAARVKRFRLTHPLDLIVVDDLQLVRSGQPTEPRYRQLGIVTQELKRIARDCEVPVVATSQLSRASQQRGDKTFLLSDLRESGNLEQDADAVIFIHRIDESDAPLQAVELILAKNRFGPTGTIPLVWDGPRVSFIDPESANG